MLVHIQRDSTYTRVATFEYNGPLAYVRIEAREPGSDPNAFPYRIDPATLHALLAAVQLPSAKERDQQLFNDSELDEITVPLARALAKASPDQDVCFAVSGRHGSYGILQPRTVTAVRLFTKDGRLQLVFGLVRHDWDSGFKGTGTVVAFEPGHRAGPIKYEPGVSISPDLGVSHRGDWLDIAPATALAQVLRPAPAPVPAGTVLAPAPGTAAAAAAAAQAQLPPAAAPAIAPAAPVGEGDKRSYSIVSERLRTLQKLRDEGLISPEEYEAKRRAILDQL
jgi:hypothetical protein